MVICEKTQRKIIPIASGKGGVGKSVVTANLGISLGRAGRSVILVDLDLGGANLHSYLGIKNKYQGIGNFISHRDIPFTSLVYPTGYENVFFVPGDALVSGAANLTFADRKAIISNVEKLQADYILLDLGSGSGFGTVDYFLASNAGLLVVTPQVTSILNVYSFLKNAVFRHVMRTLDANKRISDFLREVAREKRPGQLASFAYVLDEVASLDEAAGATARRCLAELRPHVVVNMAGHPDDLGMIQSLRSLVQKNLLLDLGCLGVVSTDAAINEAAKALRPVVVMSPDAPASRQLARMAEKINQSADFPEMPLDLSMYKDSFELAAIEAQYDYQELAGKARDDQSDQKNAEDLIAVIAAQQERIQELQSTIRMLTLQGGGKPR